MRRILVALILTLSTMAACSPYYDQPAAAAPAPTTTTVARSSSDPCVPGDKPCWEAHIARRQAEVRAWWAEVRAQQIRARDWRRLLAHLAERTAYRPGQCGGSLPPCYVMMRESRGIITARNPHSSASGKWQFLDSTWARYGGYQRAWLAPERVQDDKARQLWAGGRGCSHWSACRRR